MEAPKPIDERVLIATWLPIDADELRPLIEEFLNEKTGRTADLLPSEFNRERLLEMGMTWASAGFPTLHAVVDGQIVAVLLWGPLLQQFETKHPNTIWAMGSYTRPEYRGFRIQNALKLRALEISKSLGATRVLGPMRVQNERGIEEMKKFGAEGTLLQMELILEDDDA